MCAPLLAGVARSGHRLSEVRVSSEAAHKSETFTITSYEKSAHPHSDDLLAPGLVQQALDSFRFAEPPGVYKAS